MLEMVGSPVQQERTSNEGVVFKIATMRGNSNRIKAVALRRVADDACHQLPRTMEAVPPVYEVRVHYSTDTDGHVHVQTVHVAFDPDSWNCFYDESRQQEGECLACDGAVRFHYLQRGQFGSIIRVLEKHETQAVIRRLAKQGPEVFSSRKVE